MEDLSLHILDIVENSIRAKAENIEIKLIEDKEKNLLSLIIKDDGEGMDEETKNRVFSPFFTTKERKKTGLGLPFLYQSATEAGGNMVIESNKQKGTTIKATFVLNHIDRKPIGNIDETMKCLKVTHPDINFYFEYVKL